MSFDPGRAKELFFDALDLPPEQRLAFVDRACGTDRALADELHSLLAHHDEREILAEPEPVPSLTRTDPLGLVGVLLPQGWQVESFVAEGGFGFVYRVSGADGRPPAALKVLKPTADAERQAELEAAFAREAHLLDQLAPDSPALVRSLGSLRWTGPGGQPLWALLLEWVDGRPLSAVAPPTGGWSPAAVHALLAPAAEALGRCHHAGIAHRDVKPGNLLVTDAPPGIRLVDFGIAKVASARQGGFLSTATGFAAFTVDYAAPEQLRGAPTGPWTDVYALAMVAVELLAGHHPLAGASPMEAMLRVTDPQRRPTPRALGVRVPDGVEQLFTRALHLDPAARPPDALAFWRALAAACEGPTAAPARS